MIAETMSEKSTNIDQTTKVADFYEKHLSLFIATISATITAISIIISFLAYIYQKIILEEYKVPLDIIDTLNHGRLFYYVLMSMGIFILMPMIQSQLTSTFLQYYRNMAFDRLFRVQLRSDEERKHRDAFNTALDKEKKRFRKSLFCGILAMLFLLALVYVIYTIATGTLTYFMAGCWLATSCFLNCLLAIIQAKKQAAYYSRKKIDQFAKEINSISDQQERIKRWKDYFESILPDATPIRSYKNKYFSDGKVLEYAVTIVCSIITVSLLVVVSAFTEAKTKQEYWIYQETDRQYAVIYQNTELFVLENAIIQDEDIMIIRNQQRYIKCGDIQVKKCRFNNVIKMDEINNIDTMDFEDGITIL